MDFSTASGLLLTRSRAANLDCLKLSASRWVTVAAWEGLATHEQEFLRCLAVGAAARKAVLISRSAARLHGIWVLPTGRVDVELCNPSGDPPPKSQWPDEVVYRHFKVAEQDILVLGERSEIRVTTDVRTAIDIARIHGVREGIVAMDSLFHRRTRFDRIAMRSRLEQALASLKGRKGVPQALMAFNSCTWQSQSPYESLVRILLQERGIIARPQMEIGEYAVDLLWGQLIIEVDGAMKYSEKPHDQVLYQLTRENWLREQGYEVLRLYPSQLIKDEADCVKRVLQAKQRSEVRGPVRVNARKRLIAGLRWGL